MIEELTPQVLMTSMALLIVIGSLLTVLLSTLLLWKYRRAVKHAMVTAGSFHPAAPEKTPTESTYAGNRTKGPKKKFSNQKIFNRAVRASWLDAAIYATAIFASALLFAAVAQKDYSFNLGLPGFFVGTWIYSWPIVLALPLIVPSSIKRIVSWILLYFVIFAVLGIWTGTVKNIPSLNAGGLVLAPRSSVTPSNLAMLWVSVNALPTILTLLCFNRRVRAVAPLVLTLVTIIITGVWFALLGFSTPTGRSAIASVEPLLNGHTLWFVLTIFIFVLISLGAIGWALTRWIAHAYRKRRLSDRSLILDALWLIFACTYTMWLVLSGIEWIVTAPVGFFIYKLGLLAGQSFTHRQAKTPRGLTFLRVFSLGRRSEALFEAVTKYWRYIGSVQIITGPDLARSTVQPHQFLDFLSNKLSRHFVSDRPSLERSLAERDFERDPDGRFRINNLFCNKDSWQPALPQLIQEGDTVLMDLRNFSTSNAGCLHELRFLAANVPFDQCAFVIDDTTDKDFLKQTLREACEQLPLNSANYWQNIKEFPIQQLKSGATSVQQLIQRLCNATEQDSEALST